eukprot:05988.XXX_183217_174169_1 [CDS] Oithona nana genome sequencing.
MLQYVMTKLETHNINSDGQIRHNHSPIFQANTEEDSGTETDDETGGPDEDTMDLTDDEAGGQAITLRPTLHQHSPPRPSSTPGSLTLEVESHRIIPLAPSSEGEDEVPASFKVPSIFSCQSLDMDGGSHSSEEELEEINKIMKPTLASLNSNSCKNNLIPNSSSSSPPPIPTTPVEFSTTPPNHVHKPRRSTSPPPLVIRRSQTPTPHEVVLPSFKEFTRSQSQHLDDRRSERRAIGSKKRYKQSRIHHLQRPCLDFEKMQLLKTRAITSWRHGGELSLFCW